MTQRIDVPGMGVVEFPDGMSDDQISSAIKANMSQEWEGSSNQVKPSFSALEMLKNTPGSAMSFAKNMAGAVLHPIDTLGTLGDLGAGALRNALPQSISGAIDKFDPNPEAAQRASTTASAVGSELKQRYGGVENIKQTLQKDPVGGLADLSMAFGMGGITLPGKANALVQASKYTNPLSVLSPVVDAVGAGAKNALSLTTGVGAESISQAFKAGKQGNQTFMANLKGDVPIADVLNEAKQGLENMRAAKSAEYRSNMSAVSKDKTVLDFTNIDAELSNAFGMVTYKGQVKNAKAAQVVQKMADDVAEWKSLDPKEFHTPEGLDALKQKLGGVMESIPYEEKTARLAAGKVYNAVKAEIEKQAPGYAKTMSDYSKASEQISEIERALSLGSKFSQDTAIRKLQSLTRNNVNTNYGNRLSLAKELESLGGVDLMPAVAGQSLSSALPRGLVGQAGAMGTGYAAMLNPASLLMLPLQSPKAVGMGAYGLGKATNALGSGASNIGIQPDRVRLGGLLGYELQ